MKKIMLFFICFYFIIFGINKVIAAPVGDHTGGSITDFVSGGSATKWPNPFVAGIRVSFVKSNGQMIGRSKDYIADEDYSLVSNKSVRVSSSRCSRPSYINGSCGLSWSSETSISSIASSVSNLEQYFRNIDGSFSFPVNINTSVINEDYTTTFDSIYREQNQSIPIATYEKYVTSMFNNMLTSFGGQTMDKYIVKGNGNAVYDFFMVFEPITVLKINGTLYMGTAYELAVLAKNSPGGGFTSECNGSKNGAICDLNLVIQRSMPCTSYLDGNISAKIAEKGSLLSGFSSDRYFGNLIIDYNNSVNKCSASGGKIEVNKVTGNYGVGIGVIWPSELVTASNSCETIINGLPSDWKSKFDALYKQGGIQKIYDSYSIEPAYPNGYIEYKDDSGNTQRADLKWFLNECTCYGMYDYYNKNKLTNYYQDPNVNSIITSMDNLLGDKNWLIKPEIFVSSSTSISQQIDNGIFNGFNEENQNYATSNNLTWTPVTKEKYFEALKCGSDENWCEDFEEWYVNMTSTYSSKFRTYPTLSEIKNYSKLNEDKKGKLQTMLNTYNAAFFPKNGFNWTLDESDNGNNKSYIKNCTGNGVEKSCASIISFYQAQGQDLTKLSCEVLANKDFSEYNKANGLEGSEAVTGDWFKTNCGCNKPVGYNCTPLYNVGTCISADSINYTDSAKGVIDDEYWENCVFDDIGTYEIDVHKESNKSSPLTYYEKELGSEYCEVYCIETLTTSFTKPNITVLAGSHFTLGISSVSGGRTCKTKEVNWDKFEDDLLDANNDIVDKYVQYLLEKEKKESIDEAKKNGVEDYDECGCIKNVDGVDCCTKTMKDTCYRDELDYSCYSKESASCNSLPTYSEKAECRSEARDYCTTSEPYTCYVCDPSSITKVDNVGTYYEAEGVDVSVSSDFGTKKSDSWEGKSWCSNGGTAPTANVSGAQGAYNQAIKHAQDVVDNMKACYEWDKNKIYNVGPSATIAYSDTHYSYSGDLEGRTVYTSIKKNLKCISEKEPQIKSCNERTKECNATNISMQNCGGDGYSLQTVEAKTYFSLQKGIFQYVNKENNQSFHKNELPESNGNFTFNYIDVGYSNFPVAYSTPDGMYGQMHGKGQYDITYENLGDYDGNKTMVDTILEATENGSDYHNWFCEFRVVSKLIPENPDGGEDGNGKGDIDVIYRPIDLINPFPDIDNSKRQTGSNWCDRNGDCSYNNDTVISYINENRNVDDFELYQQEPMYTFIVTPSIVREIRKYNKSNSYASYTGSLGNQFFDFHCDEGTGRTCISDYLSHIIDITNAKNQPGTCVDDKYRAYNDSSSFENCRY